MSPWKEAGKWASGKNGPPAWLGPRVQGAGMQPRVSNCPLPQGGTGLPVSLVPTWGSRRASG